MQVRFFQLDSLRSTGFDMRTNVRTLALIAIFLAGLGTSDHSYAFCSEPTVAAVNVFGVSSFSSPPSPPFCLSGYRYSGKHSCSEWELSSYRSAVEDYVEGYKRYQAEALNVAKRFLDDANEYSRCRINEAIDGYNQNFR
jgi:hypothetical protein